MQIINRKLVKDEVKKASELFDLYVAVFAQDSQSFIAPNILYLEQLLQKENILLYVAEYEGKVVGGLTAYVLPSIHREDNEIYIYDLAVASQHQRQGIGSNLVKYLFEDLKKQNVKYVYVQADKVDDEAIAFYKKLGGKQEDVYHFDFELK